MDASDDAEVHAAQPLLSDFLASKILPKDQSIVSCQSLEDGSSISGSESELGDLRRREGFWRRLRMSLRRRARHGEAFGGVRLGDEKRRKGNVMWRTRTCLALPVLVLCVL